MSSATFVSMRRSACCCRGQKSYKGVALLSRAAAVDVVKDIPHFEDDQRRVLAATFGQLRVIDIYVPNGQEVGSEKYQYKLRWLEALRAWLQQEMARYPQLLVLSDYNIAPEDRDVHDPKAWEGGVHVSEPERAALRSLFGLGLHDLFRRFDQPADTYEFGARRTLHHVPDRSRAAALGTAFGSRAGRRPLRHAAYVWLRKFLRR
jgi:exodeoxyribonuclease III